jgi:hypothetical protein
LGWVRRSMAPSGRVRFGCASALDSNTLTGSVPSSLSALINLAYLCVPPQPSSACQRRLRVRPRRIGSVGAAPSAQHVGGIERGGVAAGLLRYSQRGPRARDGTKEYFKGHPILWVRCAGTVKAHSWCGCGVVWRRAAESASGVQTPLQQHADGECAELALCAHRAYITVRLPHSCQRRLRVRPRRFRSVSSAPSARHVGGIERGGAAAGLRYSQRGTSGTRWD